MAGSDNHHDCLILASGSPRRKEILQQMGVHYQVIVPDTDESVMDGESASGLVVRLSRQKAQAVADLCPGRPVLAADTVVVNPSGSILGKPADEADAVSMLLSLSGASHRVYSGITLIADGIVHTDYSVTRVEMREITEQKARAYWQTGEPAGKAGAYAIQGFGAVLVSAVEGSYTGVVGLPVEKTAAMLEAAGIRYWQSD